MRILLIEDHLQLVQTLTRSLGSLGIDVDACSDGAAADALLQEHGFDVIVLDLSLPRMDGLDVLRRLRGRGDTAPVLVLTASGDTADRVRGLDAGADDYLPKPFDITELAARLRALHRRSVGAGHPVLRVGTLVYDTASRRFTLQGGAVLELPPRERDLLEMLITRSGRPVGKRMLTDRLRSGDAVLSNEALELYVHRLRRRLEGSGAAIHTLRGLGYVLEPTDDAPA